VDVRLLDLDVGAGFGVLIPHVGSEILLGFSFEFRGVRSEGKIVAI